MQPETVNETEPSQCSIIVVEDDDNDVFLLKRALQQADVKNPVLLFRDGQAVIDYLGRLGTDDGKQTSHAPPALMLLDLKTPRRNGLEVLEWLRAQPALKRLVVVLMSSSGSASDINGAYDLGCNSYVLKPLTLDGLVDLVKQLDRYWLRTNQRPVATTFKQTKDALNHEDHKA